MISWDIDILCAKIKTPQETMRDDVEAVLLLINLVIQWKSWVLRFTLPRLTLKEIVAQEKMSYSQDELSSP
jgi:hypothetical protein